MTESILNSIKKMLGVDASYDAFDTDIIIGVNTAFSILTQLGVGPATGFSITGTDEEWTDFLGIDSRFNFVKTYVYLKTKMIFDPPVNGAVKEAYNSNISELESRIILAAEHPEV